MTAAADPALLDFAKEIGDAGPVAVEGSRTRWQVGGPLQDGVRVVRAPSGILAHQPEEMMVRVRAGTSVAELHEELGRKGQRTALPARGGTVGGALAVGEDHLCVTRRGRVRDAALQIRYISAEGRVVTGGGATVKNVSGFDLPRLLVGSLGTLGALAEVVLRTNPIPEASVWYESVDADPFAVPALVARPGAILWDGRRSWVSLEGHPSDVEAQRQALAEAGRWTEGQGPPALPAHHWSLRPGDLRRLRPEDLGAFVASIGVGQVFAENEPPPCPPAPALRALAARVKGRFDPTGRLNPGRSPRGGS